MDPKTKQPNSVSPEKWATWTEQGQKKAVNIVGNHGHTSTGEVFIKNWSQSERIKRSFLWGGIFFAVAVFCVLIPILHFVLVPLFLIMAPIMAYKTYQQKSVILGGLGSCPRCKVDLPIEKAKEIWPLNDLCSPCHNSVKISLIKED